MTSLGATVLATAIVLQISLAAGETPPEGLTWLPSDPLDLSLPGEHAYDLWLNLSSGPNLSRTAPFVMNGVNFGDLPFSIPGLSGGGMFPGSVMWGPYKSQFWTGSSQGELVKTANGSGGGPFPSGSSIYYGGASPLANVDGGTLGARGYPIAGVKTVAAQISIGEAYGYSLHDTGPAGIGLEDLPGLRLFDAQGGVIATLAPTFWGVIKKAFSGSLEMPPGSGVDEDIYINTFGLQWNLPETAVPVASFQFDWTGVQHAQLWSLRLDQTDVLQPEFVFDLMSHWTGASDNFWSTATNWQEADLPVAAGNAVFTTGTGVALNSPASVGQVTLHSESDFSISSLNGSKLSIALNLITEATGIPASHTVSADLDFPATTTLDVGRDTSLSLLGDVSGTGFYKRGSGPLHLGGSNRLTGTLVMGEGLVTASGTHQAFEGSLIDLKNARLILQGSDRFEAGYQLKLAGTSVPGQSAWLQLGDTSSGPIVQSFSQLNAAKPQYVKDLNPAPQLDPPVHVVGGNAEVSTLRLKGGSYSGYLGGTSGDENQLSIVIEGPVVLQGTSSYAGDTVVPSGGVLQLNRESALSPASHLVIDGGTLALGGFSYRVPGGTDDDGVLLDESLDLFTRSLGGEAGQVAFRKGALRAVGGTRTVNFGGDGEMLSWDMPGFLEDGEPLALSSDAAAHRLVFANDLDLDTSDRTIHVGDPQGIAELSGVIRGSSGIVKTGQGSLSLTGINPFTGSLRIEKGRVKFDSDEGLKGFASASEIILAGAAESTYGGGELNYSGDNDVRTDRLFTISGFAGSIANDGSGSLHFTSTEAVSFDHGGPSLLELRGTSSTPSRFDPLIADHGEFPVTLRKAGQSGIGGTGGYWILGNEHNSYTGATRINAGVLEVSRLADGGEPSSIGASSGAADNLILWRGTLRYTGGGASTDRLFAFTSGTDSVTAIDRYCRVDSSGTGALHFSNPGSLMQGDVNGGVQAISSGGWLALGGTYAGENTFAPRIGGGIAGNSRLVKDGSGTWTLLNDSNSWVGTTEIHGGALAIYSIADGGIPIVMNTTSGSATATVTSAAGLSIGLPVHGPAIPTGTTILGIVGTTITLSQPATATYASGSSRNKIAGQVSGLGSAPDAPANLVINGGALRYLGTGHTTDRRFTIGAHGATLDASGSGPIVLRNTAAAAYRETTPRTLTLTGSNTDANLLAAAIGDAGLGEVSLVKTGSGTWVLGTANRYTGETLVQNGILRMTSPPIGDAPTVRIAESGFLDLAFEGTARAAHLVLAGVDAGPGTWGAEGSGAPRTSPRILGTGFISIEGPYDSWALTISDGSQRGRSDDPDRDGFSNLAEFLFGTAPEASDGSPIQWERDGDYLILRWLELASGGIYRLEETPDLATISWPISDVAAELAADQEGVPDGYVRKMASVPIDETAKFFRVTASEP